MFADGICDTALCEHVRLVRSVWYGSGTTLSQWQLKYLDNVERNLSDVRSDGIKQKTATVPIKKTTGLHRLTAMEFGPTVTQPSCLS